MSESDARNQAHTAAMKALKAERTAAMRTKTETRSLLMIHTGDGKGKSTAAFGLVARALGWGQRVGIVQYIKGKWQTGERKFFTHFPDLLRYEVMGEGFTWDTQDRERDMAAAAKAWATSREMLADPELDLVVLDELNVALRYEQLSLADVIAALKDRPRDKHVCITGRDAHPDLIAIADLVTEMRLVKHPFAEGVKAQRGVDF